MARIDDGFDNADGPAHVDHAYFVDAAGYETLIAIAYWRDASPFEAWRRRPDIDGWWNDDARLGDGVGYFREILSPRAAHFETLFSNPESLSGIGAALGQRTEDAIQEHAYWGSMRDRIPLAQTDALAPSGHLEAVRPAPGKRVRVSGHDNVALIRSGQDWTATQASEREQYLGRMELTLRRGMDFLRDQGVEIGCYLNRYLQHVDAAGDPIERTFGLSYWRSLQHMEQWAEHHPTHVAIFGTFMDIVTNLDSPPALVLYHEVSVLKADEQDYEYIGCHDRTGLLNAI